MSRFASGAILGFFFGALLVIGLAGQSNQGFATGHFKLPLKFELEFGEAAGRATSASSVRPAATLAAASPARIPAEFQTVVEQRREIGSALAGTILDVNCPEDAEAEFVAALQSEAAKACPPLPAIEPPPIVPAGGPTSPLEASIAELYRQADACEHSCEFDRADRFRRLAREIRLEIESPAQGAPAATTADTRAQQDDGYPLD
jgi:hypothetical protein